MRRASRKGKIPRIFRNLEEILLSATKHPYDILGAAIAQNLLIDFDMGVKISECLIKAGHVLKRAYRID